MKVKIKKSSRKNYWYADKIDQEFEIAEDDDYTNKYRVIVNDNKIGVVPAMIDKTDCEVIKEEEQEDKCIKCNGFNNDDELCTKCRKNNYDMFTPIQKPKEQEECEYCEGTGEIKDNMGYECDIHSCLACHGTGKKFKYAEKEWKKLNQLLNGKPKDLSDWEKLLEEAEKILRRIQKKYENNNETWNDIDVISGLFLNIISLMEKEVELWKKRWNDVNTEFGYLLDRNNNLGKENQQLKQEIEKKEICQNCGKNLTDLSCYCKECYHNKQIKIDKDNKGIQLLKKYIDECQVDNSPRRCFIGEKELKEILQQLNIKE